MADTAPDSDGDGVADDVERMLGTDPHNPDTDAPFAVPFRATEFEVGRPYSGVGVELDVVDRSALDALATVDTDGDGLSDAAERQLGTDPHDPNYQSPFDPPNADDYPGGPDWDDRHPEGPQASDAPPDAPSSADQLGVVERIPGHWHFGDGAQERAADLERSQGNSGDSTPPDEPAYDADAVVAKPALTDTLADAAVVPEPVTPPAPEPDPLGDVAVARHLDSSSSLTSADDEPFVG